MRETFPVLEDYKREDYPQSVPWALVEPHRERAIKNHDQTLEVLARRGGLSPCELWCLCHDHGLFGTPDPFRDSNQAVVKTWLLQAARTALAEDDAIARATYDEDGAESGDPTNSHSPDRRDR